MPIPTIPRIAVTTSGLGLKALKTSGGGYEFTLTHNGGTAATVKSGRNGGPTQIEWASGARAAAARYALEGIIAAYPTFHYRGMDVRVTPEIVLGEVLNIAEMRKTLRTKTIFQVNGTEYQIKAAYDATVAAQIRGMYPDAVILNEDPAYAVAA
jgi:hypothetical protein